MQLVTKLLRKNTSPARIAGIVVSNLIGLAIIAGGLQFYLDAKSIWSQQDSFINTDFIVVNKRIDADAILNPGSAVFSQADTDSLNSQPWVRKTGAFEQADFRVYASLDINTLTKSTPGNDSENTEPTTGRTMQTAMFFEAVPDEFLDTANTDFSWHEGSPEVPLIISKDYLALYNFGFAGSAGLPQLSEQLVSGLPLKLVLTDDSGTRSLRLYGRIAGYSNRFNTILVPHSFLTYANNLLAPSTANRSKAGKTGKTGASNPQNPQSGPSRLIIDVASPGDAAIDRYLEAHGLETAGDKSSAQATYLLKVVTGIIITVGTVITLLSIFILLLSMSLLMEKNRHKIHSLLMLGYTRKSVAKPYRFIAGGAAITAALLAYFAVLSLRSAYLQPIQNLGGHPSSAAWSLLTVAVLTLAIIIINFHAIRRRIDNSWRLRH